MPTNDLVMSPADIESAVNSVSDEPMPTTNDGADIDVPSSWEDGYESDSEESSGKKSSAPATAKQSQAIREFKANGAVHKVDLSDQKRVDELISLGLGARPAFSERDKLRKQVSARDKQLSELNQYKEMWSKLEAAKSHSKEALYEKVFGEKFSDAVARESQRRASYEAATPDERRMMDYEAKMQEHQRALEQREAEWNARQKDVESKAKQAEIKELRSMLLPEFQRHEFSSRIKDPDRAQELNAVLWQQTIANLKRKHGADIEQLTPDLARKEFKRVASLLSSGDAKEEVKAITEKKKQESKTQAQAASTRNYKQSDPRELAKEKDPVKLWRKMFG